MIAIALMVAPLLLGAGSKDDMLGSAEKLCGQLKYAACLDALDKATLVEGRSRATTVRLLELQGLTAAALNQPARATAAFHQLFLIDPAHQFPTSYSPRVNTQILEARSWAREKGPLSAAASDSGDGDNRTLEVRVENDPTSIARDVRIHARAKDGEWLEQTARRDGSVFSVTIAASSVEWWAEVMGDRAAVLVELGSARDPMTSHAPARSTAAAPLREGEPTRQPQSADLAPQLSSAPVHSRGAWRRSAPAGISRTRLPRRAIGCRALVWMIVAER
jgi:hypothetical protein